MTRIRALLEVVNPAGWAVLALGALAAAGLGLTHWRELAVLAAACAVLVTMALPFLVGRTRLAVRLTLDPSRVTAGGTVAAAVEVRNLSGRRSWPLPLELPVGPALHRFTLPALGPSSGSPSSGSPVPGSAAAHVEPFTIRAERRGVIEVGPVLTRRGDPLGLFSRDLARTGVHEILVRPSLVPLEQLGAGLLRDLEGVTTEAVTHSDLAFHALREYAPGDDLRHVHWRSSARAMSATGENQLLVRQYLDTRRSHVSVVVDDDARAWASEDDFETAMSVAASIVVRAAVDEMETSFFCGPVAATRVDGQRTLDAVCRAGLARTPAAQGVSATAATAARTAPDTSLLLCVSGTGTPFSEVQRALTAFSPEVRRIAVVVDPSAPSRVGDAAGLGVVHLRARDDLPGLLRWSLR
ncbi:DUF58 domain-containing protein [Nocardioides pacificus]